MPRATFDELLDAGVHFGHLKRKWNPNMAPYIFEEKKGIHIIDLHKTTVLLDDACSALNSIARSGKKIMFVATKKQAKGIVSDYVDKINMPYVTERWSGGMLTNFATIRKSIRKMGQIEKMKGDGSWDTLSKREKLFKERQRAKLEKNLGTIADMTRLPAAIFVVDISKEHIAVSEARKLGIPVFGLVDTNSDPQLCAFPIPANDDASKSIAKIMEHVCGAIAEGLDARRTERSTKEEGGTDTPAVETAPATEAPVAEASAPEAPAAAAPVEEAPAPEAPAAAAPVEEAPAPEAPATPAPAAAAAEAEAEAPAPEAPETPVTETPAPQATEQPKEGDQPS